MILVGGGHCKSVIETAESAGFSILGVLDMPEEVGKNVILNTATIIEHDADIDNPCLISTGTMVNGGTYINKRLFLESQSVVNQGVKIMEVGEL